MAVLPANIARVSNLLRTNVSLGQIQTAQAKMLRVQNQLVTGRKLNAPSDNPGDAAIAQQVRKTLEQRQAYDTNLESSKSQLSAVDSTLGDITDLLQQAQTLAQANVGDDVTQAARDAAAAQLDSVYGQLVDLGNKSFNGSYLFAGDELDQPPFTQTEAGVTFVGSEITLKNQVDESTDAGFQVDGAAVWGALSTRIESKSPLSPEASAATRLGDLAGTANSGVRRGMIAIGNGTDTAKIDLSAADTLGDVVTAINAAGVGVTAAISAGGNGLTLSGGAGDSIGVTDLAGGTAAADLGILKDPPAAAGTPVVGANAGPKVTGLTPLAALNGGAGIDASGLNITNGGKSATIVVAAGGTVQDLINAVNGSGTGVRMDVSADGRGLRLLNTTQGTPLAVSENNGTTASDLGLRSFDEDSKLQDFNGGRGVGLAEGADFTVTDSAGVVFDVDLVSGDTTVQDVLDKINAAATAAGASVAASLATTSNGIALTDTAAGGGTLRIERKNVSTAALDLGLDEKAVGNVITGRDVNPVKAQGVLANIDSLRKAMRGGDKLAITTTAEAIKGDYDRVVLRRGEVGARVQAVESRQDRLADQNVATKALLSKLEDTDFTEAATEYSMLQTGLQAAMQTTSTMLNLSLMDFLR